MKIEHLGLATKCEILNFLKFRQVFNPLIEVRWVRTTKLLLLHAQLIPASNDTQIVEME